jgi:hypothetical protein
VQYTRRLVNDRQAAARRAQSCSMDIRQIALPLYNLVAQCRSILRLDVHVTCTFSRLLLPAKGTCLHKMNRIQCEVAHSNLYSPLRNKVHIRNRQGLDEQCTRLHCAVDGGGCGADVSVAAAVAAVAQADRPRDRPLNRRKASRPSAKKTFC